MAKSQTNVRSRADSFRSLAAMARETSKYSERGQLEKGAFVRVESGAIVGYSSKQHGRASLTNVRGTGFHCGEHNAKTVARAWEIDDKQTPRETLLIQKIRFLEFSCNVDSARKLVESRSE